MVRFKRTSKTWTERERLRMLHKSRKGIRKQHPLRGIPRRVTTATGTTVPTAHRTITSQALADIKEPDFLEETANAWAEKRRASREILQANIKTPEKPRIASKKKDNKKVAKKVVKKVVKKRKRSSSKKQRKQRELALSKSRMIRCYWCSCEEAYVWTRTLKNRDTLIQHKCAAFGKTITRTVDLVFSKCSAPNNHDGPCMKLIEDPASKGIVPPEKIKKRMDEEQRIRREAEREAALKRLTKGPSTSEEDTDTNSSQ